MILEFSVENYRSLKKEATLSLVASSDKTSLTENLITDVLKEDNVLRSAAVYGANASGKTNVLLALNFFKRLILNSATHPKGKGIRFEPFKLDGISKTKPTRFKVIFVKEGVKYIYALGFNRERVIYEYVHFYKSIQPSILFERFFDKQDIKKISKKDVEKFHKIQEYYYYFPKSTKKQKEIADKTNENTLYLSKTRTENFNPTDAIYKWFDELIFMGPDGVNEDFTLQLAKKDEKYKNLILRFLNTADFGIDNFKSESKEIQGFDNFPEQVKSFFSQNPHVKPSDKIVQQSFQIFHKGIPLFLNEQSEGTKRMFSLTGHIIDALEKGKILIFDEMDVKLHPELQRHILSLFNNSEQNKHNAQIIFTTHNTNLLDQEILRRDQIWFTEKDPKTCATELYSLLEFKPRKDKNLQRGYLAGKFGALPFIKDSNIL